MNLAKIINVALFGENHIPAKSLSSHLTEMVSAPIYDKQSKINRLLQHYEKLQRIRMLAIKEADFYAKHRTEILINNVTSQLNNLSEG